VPQFLIDLANERGGDDNITVVVVYVGNDRSDG
jgi:serine/threonine protein phosphatase PrpC